MTAYYNDNNEDAAAVLEAQIEDGVIAPGVVDTRSIKDVHPNDLIGFTQCHFFAGGGLWSVAARMAGWPDDRPIWTGSCPCQPFSTAGKGGGTDDPRHLWPDFYRLICAGRPDVVMGEQVAGAPGYGWFDGVRSDLAAQDYASRTVDIPACAVDAPHKRSRLFWGAMANSFGASVGRHAGNARGSAVQGQRETWPTDGTPLNIAMMHAAAQTVVMALWSTARASDGAKGGPNQSFGAGGQPLPAQMHQCATALGGQTQNGSSATTEKRGVPNPAFPCWLMGFPDEWVSGALRAMRSRPSSRRKSSQRSSTNTDSQKG